MVGDLADPKALWLQATEKTGWFEKENMMLYLVWLCACNKKASTPWVTCRSGLGAAGCRSLLSAARGLRPCAWGSVATVAAHSRCSFLGGCPGRGLAVTSCLAWLSSHLGSQGRVQAGHGPLSLPLSWRPGMGGSEWEHCHASLKTLFISEGFMWTARFVFGSMHLGERKEKNGSWHLVVSAL